MIRITLAGALVIALCAMLIASTAHSSSSVEPALQAAVAAEARSPALTIDDHLLMGRALGELAVVQASSH